MMRRVCGCGHVTTADLPAGVRGGPTCYGPNVTAAATLLASVDVIGIERAADLMSALLGVTVSTGFVSSCLVRLDTALTTAGFEDALKDALRAADVLGTDETPAPLTEAATQAPGCHNPHVYTVRTMGAYTRVGDGPSRDLVWYGAAGDRTKASISGFGILDTYRGVLVRDDYGGYLSYDAGLAGVQQCLAHALRYLDDAYATRPRLPGLGPSGRRSTAGGDRCGEHRPRPGPDQPAPPSAGPAAPLLRQRRRSGGSRRTPPGDGTRATTPDYNSHNDCAARPTSCGSSRPGSMCPPRTTDRSPPSVATSWPPRSADAGGPWPPFNATAGSAPTWPAPATTDTDPSTQSGTP